MAVKFPKIVMAVKLGEIVTDSITGHTGTAVAIYEHLNGCKQALVQAKCATPDSLPPESKWFDEQFLTKKPTAKAGAPAVSPPMPSQH
jgi:hypothetical protein